MIKFYFLGVLSSFIVAVSQALLKIGADKHGHKHFIKQYFNLFVILGYILFFGVTVNNVFVYSKLPLQTANIFMGLSYVFVALIGKFFLHEDIGLRSILGVLLICLGIGFFIV